MPAISGRTRPVHNLLQVFYGLSEALPLKARTVAQKKNARANRMCLDGRTIPDVLLNGLLFVRSVRFRKFTVMAFHIDDVRIVLYSSSLSVFL